MRKQRSGERKGFAHGHVQLIIEPSSRPSGHLVFLDQLFCSWKTCCQQLNESSRKVLHLRSGFRVPQPHISPPAQLCAYIALKLPGISVWCFMCPLRMSFWRGLRRRLSVLALKEERETHFTSTSFGQQDRSYERSFSSTHSFIWFPHTSRSQSGIFDSRGPLIRGKPVPSLIQILYFF